METWLPSLNALRAFEAVSRHLSYRDAADELNVTPAAVKQLVLKLEESIGFKLVRRHGKGIALTPESLIAINDLRLGFRQLNDAVSKLRETRERQTLTLSVEPSFAMTWLVKRINRFKSLNPEIDVLIDSSPRIIDLQREPVDVAIRYAVTPIKELVHHRLFDDETLAVCSPSVAAGPPQLSKLDDLQHVPLIHMDMHGPEWISTAYRNLFDWNCWFANIGVPNIQSTSGVTFTDYNLAVQAAIAGQGVVLGSYPLVKDALEVGLLVAPFKERAKAELGYDLVTTKKAATNPRVMAFVDWVLDEIRNPGDHATVS